MNLVQLRSLCEIVDHGLSISEAAKATQQSQPSVSRQLQDLEQELGFDIFVRKRNRILAVTRQGNEIVRIARGMLHDAENIRRIGAEITKAGEGTFAIATTHTQARYTLPGIISSFVAKYPKVRLSLRQGTPGHCCELVARGEADIAICSDPPSPIENLASIPCYRMNRSVVTLAGHPVLTELPLTLKALANYPLITYGESFGGSSIVINTFAAAGIAPNFVLSAMDADVSKIYVRMGLGIAIFTSIVVSPTGDPDLRVIDARHLFKANSLNVFLRKRSHLRSYMFDFIEMFAPRVTRRIIKNVLFGEGRAASKGHLPDLKEDLKL